MSVSLEQQIGERGFNPDSDNEETLGNILFLLKQKDGEKREEGLLVVDSKY